MRVPLAAWETEPVVAALVGVAGTLWGFYAQYRSWREKDKKQEADKRAQEEADARQRTTEWVQMHVAERDRVLKRLDEQQRDHMAAREAAARLSAEVEALRRENEELRKRLAIVDNAG